jgi:DivIVA domain-containing protein
MALTPLDAEKYRFRSVLRGYARDEVERFRAEVIAALEGHIARAAEMNARAGELESQLARYRESEDLLKSSVVLAQRTCDELIAAAHKQADAIKQEARTEGEQIRLSLADLRAQREQFEYAFHGLLTGFKHRLEQGNPVLAEREPPAALGSPADLDSADSIEPPCAETEAPASDDEPAPQRPHVMEPRLRIPEVPAPPSPRVPGVPAATTATGPTATAVPADDPDADIADFSAAVAQAAEKRDEPWPAPAVVPPPDSSAEPDEQALPLDEED